MNITIIGAGGGIGLSAVAQALEKGHQVTALSTKISAMSDHPMLTKIEGNATSLADLKRALQGADVLLVTVGTKNKKATTLFSDIARALIQAVAEMDYKPAVLIVTGFGAGESKRYLNFFMRTVIRFFLKDQYVDKSKMEELITESALKWEIVRPGMLTNGALTRTYKVLPDLYKGMKINKIARYDVAHYLIDEAENQKLLYQYVAVAS